MPDKIVWPTDSDGAVGIRVHTERGTDTFVEARQDASFSFVRRDEDGVVWEWAHGGEGPA